MLGAAIKGSNGKTAADIEGEHIAMIVDVSF